ncbi:unnamed protein product [Malus baccata var. baccata]
MVSKLVLVLLLFHHVVIANSSYSSQKQYPSCPDEEKSALLQFKDSFTIDKSASRSSMLIQSCLHGSINSNSSLFRLVHLQRLNLSDNNFNYSQIPPTIRNFPSLTHLDLSTSVFSGRVPSELSLLSKLTNLNLALNLDRLSEDKDHQSSEERNYPLLKLEASDLGSLVQNLTSLEVLTLSFVNVSSAIPHSMANLSSLTALYLRDCHLFGEFPVRIFQLPNLESLSVRYNPDLTGYFPEFNQSSPLILLKVGFTGLFGTIPSSIQNLHSLQDFDVAQCNFSEGLVPSFLGNLRQLTYLDISANKFGDQLPLVLPWVKLLCIRFYSNMFHGSLPIPPPTMREYAAADNNFTGEISPLLCNMKNLLSLDLSQNNLGGMLPQCLGNFSDHLILLLLGNNSFHGIIPQTYNKGSSLRMIDVSHNKLQGQLPRSLANCVILEYLVLSNNRFNDVFPIWLGTLLELKLLAMRRNGFYGVIGKSRKNVDFPKLRILDLAYNDFTGVGYDVDGFPVFNNVSCQLMIATKGLEQYYPKIREEFASFDISSNKFEGKIPEFIGNLKELRSLNLSHNILTGSIPSSFGNLMKLESLDLSQNKLSGRIPQQLVQLNFLSSFNVSHNNLTGAIPQGTQLSSLNVTSYEGNPGLCGDPLPKKCGNPKAPELPPSTVDEGDSSSEGIFELDWKIVSAGCGSGLVVGVVLADVVITRRPDLFLKIVGMIRQMIRKI